MLGAIGKTPIVRLDRLVEQDAAEVWVKLESCNPTGSYKDRMALAMVEGAERSGSAHRVGHQCRRQPRRGRRDLDRTCDREGPQRQGHGAPITDGRRDAC